MTTLAEFLLARIAEDEAGYPGVVQTQRDLDEAAAKRGIVEWHHGTIDGWCSGCGYELPSPCPNLRMLAAIYADHPDYREEWRA